MFGRADAKLGAGVERLVIAHHRRRLTARGRLLALEPPDNGIWTAGDPPPREGNSIELLIDGDDALARMQDALQVAKSSVIVAGWHVSPTFKLRQDGPSLRELLAELAERVEVRVLLWAGAPLPLFSSSAIGFHRRSITPCGSPSTSRLTRRLGGETPTHRLARLPYVSRHARRLLGPLDSLLVDG